MALTRRVNACAIMHLAVCRNGDLVATNHHSISYRLVHFNMQITATNTQSFGFEDHFRPEVGADKIDDVLDVIPIIFNMSSDVTLLDRQASTLPSLTIDS